MLLKKNEEEVKNLIEIVNKKESETNQAEKQHQQLSIFHNNYSPAFIDNLDRDEKYELKNQINAKIRNINLAISKSIMLQKEMEVIEKFRKRQKNRGIDEDEEENNKKKKLPLIKKNRIVKIKKISNHMKHQSNSQNNIFNFNDNNKNGSLTNTEKNKNINNTTNQMLISADSDKSNFISSLNSTKNKIINFGRITKFQQTNSVVRSSSYNNLFTKNGNNLPFADRRFKICKNQFDEKFDELIRPFEYLIRNNKRANILPKII